MHQIVRVRQVIVVLHNAQNCYILDYHGGINPYWYGIVDAKDRRNTYSSYGIMSTSRNECGFRKRYEFNLGYAGIDG